MRLRTRFEELMKERVAEYLPAAVATVWDAIGLVAAIETIKFEPVGGVQTDDTGVEWNVQASLSGVIWVEMRADAIDALVVEPLVANLVSCPAFVSVDPAAADGEMTEQARCTLIEMRDAVRDTQIVSKLRFSVQGFIMERIENMDRPALMVGQYPETGADHEADYKPLDGDLSVAIVGGEGGAQ